MIIKHLNFMEVNPGKFLTKAIAKQIICVDSKSSLEKGTFLNSGEEYEYEYLGWFYANLDDFENHSENNNIILNGNDEKWLLFQFKCKSWENKPTPLIRIRESLYNQLDWNEDGDEKYYGKYQIYLDG